MVYEVLWIRVKEYWHFQSEGKFGTCWQEITVSVLITQNSLICLKRSPAQFTQKHIHILLYWVWNRNQMMHKIVNFYCMRRVKQTVPVVYGGLCCCRILMKCCFLCKSNNRNIVCKYWRLLKKGINIYIYNIYCTLKSFYFSAEQKWCANL
jgi:hypothetical protein